MTSFSLKTNRFQSHNPATQTVVWEGIVSDQNAVDQAIQRAKTAFSSWSQTTLADRKNILRRYAAILENKLDFLSNQLAEEHGKPQWEAKTEVQASIQKIAISIEAYDKRCASVVIENKEFRSATRYKPHGVLAVLGPFNLPLHLPNGHIVPALLAGNTVVFKPSELTPRIAEHMLACWHEAGLPASVLQVIQGDDDTGQALSSHSGLAGLLFTGSARTGLALNRLFADQPGKILALEMGGNNPLILHDLADSDTAAYHVLVSAFITSGQRCTCARRLIVLDTPAHRKWIKTVVERAARLQIGAYNQTPQPFMGPLISPQAADRVREACRDWVKRGAEPLLGLDKARKGPWMSPVILDVTGVKDKPDEEIFGPVLQVIWVKDLNEALAEANRTAYGLSAGIFTDKTDVYDHFFREIKAGIVNWNRPLTGASSNAPFGGIGRSGNHRPSAYFAADYCAYPVASQEELHLHKPASFLPGVP